MKLIDLTDRQFGRLTVICRGDNDIHGKPMWVCKCECGSVKTILGLNLRGGTTNSCWCIHKEVTTELCRELGKKARTHGMTLTPEYQCWQNMKNRCFEFSCSEFKNYGGRGITVCDEWINSFESFIAYIGLRPSNKHSIDRIDVNGNYEPGNVRWATIDIQNSNKRNSKRKS